MDKKIKVVMAKIKLGLPIARNEFATVVLFSDDELDEFDWNKIEVEDGRD
mgnify:FL=1